MFATCNVAVTGAWIEPRTESRIYLITASVSQLGYYFRAEVRPCNTLWFRVLVCGALWIPVLLCAADGLVRLGSSRNACGGVVHTMRGLHQVLGQVAGRLSVA
jgi:hypothetical protein